MERYNINNVEEMKEVKPIIGTVLYLYEQKKCVMTFLIKFVLTELLFV